MDFVPLTVGDSSSAMVAELLGAASVVGVPSEETDAAYMTNAVAYEMAGVAAVVFGPGAAAQAHKVDEYIELGEMERSIAVLKRFFSK